MTELKYSEETFRDMYEALKAISKQFRVSHIGIGVALSMKIKSGEKAIAKVEGKHTPD